jgi:hypothetical protein
MKMASEQASFGIPLRIVADGHVGPEHRLKRIFVATGRPSC